MSAGTFTPGGAWLHGERRSYWQRGADDAKAGLPPSPPTKDGPLSPANHGYLNGYRWAKQSASQSEGRA